MRLVEASLLAASRAERVRGAWLAVTEATLVSALTAAADGMGLDLREIEDPAAGRHDTASMLDLAMATLRLSVSG